MTPPPEALDATAPAEVKIAAAGDSEGGAARVSSRALLRNDLPFGPFRLQQVQAVLVT